MSVNNYLDSMLFIIYYLDPMYSLEFLANGWFVRFLGHVFELVFTVILFSTWFFEINKLRSVCCCLLIIFDW
jgi:hypothetical protein